MYIIYTYTKAYNAYNYVRVQSRIGLVGLLTAEIGW